MPEHAADDGPTHRSETEVSRAKLRARLFFAFSMGLAVPLFCIMTAMYPMVIVLDKYRRRAEHVANALWAALSTFPFVHVEVLAPCYRVRIF